VNLQFAAQKVVRAWGQRGFPSSMRDLALALELDDYSRLLENVAAITSGIRGDEQWRKFYAAVSDAVGGFPGIWQLCIQAAREFTEEEASGEVDGFDWIHAVELFAGEILSSPPDRLTNPLASSSYLRTLAKISIRMSS
jgi:hypothetical protein